jgi:hypothetical protein
MVMLLTIILEIAAAAVLLQAMGRLNNSVLEPLSRDSVGVLVNETYQDCCFVAPEYVQPKNASMPLCWTLEHASTMSLGTSCTSAAQFSDDFFRWLKSQMTPMVATALSVMSLELLVIIASCCAICTSLPRCLA